MAAGLQSFTATASQTAFTFTGGITYATGGNNLAVYINGIRVRITDDFTETSTTVFTLTTASNVGDQVTGVTL